MCAEHYLETGFCVFCVCCRALHLALRYFPPKLKVRTPAHTKHLGWYLEFEFRGYAGHRLAATKGVLTPLVDSLLNTTLKG